MIVPARIDPRDEQTAYRIACVCCDPQRSSARPFPSGIVDRFLTLSPSCCHPCSGCAQGELSHFLEKPASVSPTGGCGGSECPASFSRSSCDGILNALNQHWSSLEWRLEGQKKQVEPMSTSNSAVLPVPTFPAGVHVHWETQRRMAWNVREHTSEERELVYEISWIPELRLWRSFLRSQRKVKS